MLWIIGILGMIAFIWLLIRSSEGAIVGRNLNEIPEGSIMSCKDGDVVRLCGKAEKLTSTLTAPLSGRECIYYKIIVDQSDGDNLVNIINDEKGVNFIIREGSRIAVISTYRVMSFIIKKEEYSSGFLNDATDVLETYLKRFGQSSINFFGLNHSITYEENIIEIDEQVTVGGQVKWVPGFKVGLPDIEKVLYMKAIGGKHPLYLSSDPTMF